MSEYRHGLKPFDADKHGRFNSSAYYGFAFPAPSYPIDRRGTITDLGMGGNGPDKALTVNGGKPCGDCGPNAVPKNVNQTTAALLGEAYTALTSNQIVTLYFIYQAQLAGIAWRPSGDDWTAPDGLDQGVDLGDWLLWLFTHDLDGNVVKPGEGLIEGFVKLEDDEVDAALGLGFAIVCGVSLNPDADQQCEDGEKWDIGPGDEPDPEMGHAIELGLVEAPEGDVAWGTWGQWQLSTGRWRKRCAQQYFAVLTAEQAAASGFPFVALCSDLKALAGTVVIPSPALGGLMDSAEATVIGDGAPETVVPL